MVLYLTKPPMRARENPFKLHLIRCASVPADIANIVALGTNHEPTRTREDL